MTFGAHQPASIQRGVKCEGLVGERERGGDAVGASKVKYLKVILDEIHYSVIGRSILKILPS